MTGKGNMPRVSDPKICHTQPTFRGTRILVADGLEQVASGMAWKNIVAEWWGSISHQISASVKSAIFISDLRRPIFNGWLP